MSPLFMLTLVCLRSILLNAKFQISHMPTECLTVAHEYNLLMDEELRKVRYVRIASHWPLQLQKGGQMTDHRDSKE